MALPGKNDLSVVLSSDILAGMNPDEFRRRTIGQEFRDSLRAGPRAWLVAVVIFLFLWTFPLLGLLALFLAPLVLVPALFGAVLGRTIGRLRDRWTLVRLQRERPAAK